MARSLGRTAAVAVVVATLLSACANKDAAAVRAAPRITDTAFERAAAAVCHQAAGVFDADTTLPKEPTRAQSADFLENLDATFTRMVSRLRTLPVAPEDRKAVDAWLSDWDAYVAYGHTYAAAVRAGTDQQLVRRDAASQGALRRRLRAFATANHMPECRFA